MVLQLGKWQWKITFATSAEGVLEKSYFFLNALMVAIKCIDATVTETDFWILHAYWLYRLSDAGGGAIFRKATLGIPILRRAPTQQLVDTHILHFVHILRVAEHDFCLCVESFELVGKAPPPASKIVLFGKNIYASSVQTIFWYSSDFQFILTCVRCFYSSCGGGGGGGEVSEWSESVKWVSESSEWVKWVSEVSEWSEWVNWESEVSEWSEWVNWVSEVNEWNEWVKWVSEVSEWSEWVKCVSEVSEWVKWVSEVSEWSEWVKWVSQVSEWSEWVKWVSEVSE